MATFDVDARLAEWRTSLLDTSRRNRLIKFVAGRTGGVFLLHPPVADLWTRLVRDGAAFSFPTKRELLGLPRELIDADALNEDSGPVGPAPDAAALAREMTEQCLRSPALRPTQLLTEFTDRQLAARLTRLSRAAKEAALDHGVTTLFTAFGFLRWVESETPDEEMLAPLLLVPVRLERRTVDSEFTLRAEEDEILPNHCLAELLRSQFRIDLPTAAECPLDPDNPECLPAYLAAVRERVKQVARWEVIESAALGVFNFQKLAMWEDLGRNAERVKAHEVCRAVAGDASQSLSPPDDLPAAEDLDRLVPPETATHILDADSSQHEAIEAVKHGAHLVMDGPPGTGKSQTIANIIAEALSAGRTVLFVSEKTAALEVVKRRLDRCGLGDFCLELHSHKASKKDVIAELGRCLSLPPAGAPDVSMQMRQLALDRKQLNDFVTELHAVRHPLGWTAFRAHGELARLDRGTARSRIPIRDVFEKDAEYLRQAHEILAGLADCGSVVGEPGGHPWRGCKITTYSNTVHDDAEYEIGRLSDVLGPVIKAAAALGELGFGAEPCTLPDWRAAEADTRSILAVPPFPEAWLAGDAAAAARARILLDLAANSARSLAGRLPEFDAKATRRIVDPQTIAALLPDRERVADAMTLTVRARVDVLNRSRTALAELVKIANDLHSTARTVAGFLQMTRTPNADHLIDLAEVAHEIAEGPPVPLDWWTAQRRADVLEAFQLAAREERNVNDQRLALLKRFSPAALEPEALMLVVEAARLSRSFFLRLLPRWWSVKSEVQSWYVGPPPGTSELRDDLAELEAYHRRAVAVRQVTAEYTPDSVSGPGGRPDWDASATRVHAVEWLDQIGVLHPFKAAAGPRRTLNVVALGDAARSLERLATALRDGWNRLLSEFSIPDAQTQLARPAAELARFLAQEELACRDEADALSVLVTALSPQKDVLPGVQRERILALRDLVAARKSIADAAAVLGEARTLEELEGADHAAEGARARALLEILESLSRPLSPPVARSFSDAVVRDKLGVALRQSEAARRPFDKSWDKVTETLFDPNAEVSCQVILNKLPLESLKKWAADRAGDTARLAEWTRFSRVVADATAFGLGAMIAEVEAGEVPPAATADAFRARFFRLWLDAVHQQVPTLGSFASDTHDRLIARFGELDRLAVRTAPDRVRNRLLANTARPMARDSAPDSSELGILMREINKKRRHLPLRTLFANIPSILPRIKPCLMMSPLAVSTYLDNEELTFDLVIFDEASQVRPHDAICALYRGRQLVVGGDPCQLPPTDFFNRSTEDADETEQLGTAPFESLLDVCLALGLPRKRLKWHYRSRREALIAFSNRHFYEDRLVTFPSADEATAPSVNFTRVPDGRFVDGVNPIEARLVAALIMKHARVTPDWSLGVIAFSQRQQDRILDELEDLRRAAPDVESFFSESNDDPFFVKNLENVQGDERDVILLSVGYGPDAEGKVAMRFGPLNRAGGERRLNVAVTRARHAMTVVSSITAADIDLSRTSAMGARLLRAYLDFAERGIESLKTEDDAADRNRATPFEQEVGDELVRRGLIVDHQIGCGEYRVDLAIVDPAREGRYLLGVECDGATYHAAATARDRDRLRQAVLEGLGWRLVRVWSTDWVRDRDKQVRRILSTLEAIKHGDPLPRRREPEVEKAPALRRKHSRALEFESIETVPVSLLNDSVLSSLAEFGSMPAEDLISAVARRLGFKRSGPKIRERIAGAVNELMSDGKLILGENDRVRLAVPPRLVS